MTRSIDSTSPPLVGLASVAALLAAAVAGCGGAGSHPSSSAAQPGAGRQAHPASLAAPLYASCGTSGFDLKPPAPSGKPASLGWHVTYTRSATVGKHPHPAPGPVAAVLIMEAAPQGPRGSLPGAQERQIGSKQVSFSVVNPSVPAFVARWKTEEARYVAIARGASERTFTKLIACMP